MRVLKVVAEGQITSFRYPHFMQQIHPTYWMPPPSTIYGHISSALGEWFNPAGVSFAYQFTYEAKVKDVEHIIVLSPTGERSKLPGTDITKVLEGNVNPFDRELLFRPRLVLYINQPEWIDAFRSPRYAVVLGRSQDLFTYTSIEVIDLEQADRAYFEHTLAPHEMALQFGRGISVLMPRYVDNERNRAPTFQQYVMLQNRVHLPDSERLQFSNVSYGPYWIDPSSAVDKGSHLGLPFLTFVDEAAS
ncbi:type I-B CRISPR-associated protein Cas5 [bacterium]|nr:type I-B CRISPR-associated protein Cas5 [bacterium]